MKKSIAIVLIVIAVVFCTCPSLVFGGINLYTASSPAMAATLSAQGSETLGQAPQSSPLNPMTAMITGGCALCVGVLIPIVVGLITLRMARKKEAESLPPQ